ncbi:MAG TPA: polyprenyl synthetase family protein [Acidimicrobiales bacterium]|nr:polyprenyl synthetase family protein [Acidimicrobiales bacterium]
MQEAPSTLGEIAKRVDARIEELLDAEIVRWAGVDVALVEPLRSLREFVLAGGKRLRPAFCLWAYVGAGGDRNDAAVTDAGAGLELLHTFALIHDDVMDNSHRRRGMPTVHRQFEDTHAELLWRGETRRFGEGAAILIGDLAFVYADQMLRGAPADAIDVFNELRLEVNVGQYLDLVGTVRGDITVDGARTISRYKSGKYTVERPLHLGAALAGRLDDLAAPLTAYGDPLGEAFQLRDDLLGTFGDAARTGKPVGEDLREGKPTPLFALARDAATGADAELLARRYGAADLSPDEVVEMQAIFERTGARAAVDAQIDRLVDAALLALAAAPITAEAGDELDALARFVAERDF